MKFNKNIFELAKQNAFFRQEVATGEHSQVVLMSIPPAGEIGMEVHKVDQILVFVEGNGETILDGETSPIGAGSLVFVPAGTNHNFINTGATDLKLFTVYSPPQHKPGTIHKTKVEADADEEHY